MKLFILAMTLLFTAQINASSFEARKNDKTSVIKIEIGDESYSSDNNYSKKDMARRVYRLERAVRQLQQRVFDLEIENDNLKDENDGKYTCILSTPFDGIFTATKKTKMAATANVLKQCSSKKEGSIHCRDSNVKCDNQ